VEVGQVPIPQLIVLDAKTGERLQELSNPDGRFYSFPRWMEDGQRIVVVSKQGEQNQLELIDLTTEESTTIVPSKNAQITHPYPFGNTIYFSSTYTGVNNIYAVKIGESNIYQVTDHPLGAFQPAVSADGQELAYSGFSSDGYAIESIPIDESQWQLYQWSTPFGLRYFQSLVEHSGGSIIPKVPNESFEVKRFNRFSGLIFPHSWIPTYERPVAGLSILSDNRFSTLSAALTANYNFNDEEWTFLGDLKYAELFTEINVGGRLRERELQFLNFRPLNPEVNDSIVIQSVYTEVFDEREIRAGLELPLNFSGGNFFNRLNIITDYNWIDLDVAGRLDQASFQDTFKLLSSRQDLFVEPLRSTSFGVLYLRVFFTSFRQRSI